MKVLLFICFFSFGCICVRAQTGFYLEMDKTTPCATYLFSFDQKEKYCITDEPIIGTSEFKAEGEIRDDLLHNNQYFNLRFTRKGIETLKLICDHLPEKKLIFVVNGKVAGTYQNKNFKPALLMPISGKTDSKELKWVYSQLTNTN